MTPESRLEVFARGWRGPLLAALVALAAGLPALFGLPPLDRGEARIAQATAQAIETRDLVDLGYQDESRERAPPAIHWLQAASVSALSSVEARHIWAYRIPSLLGTMLAAAACAWGAAAFFGAGPAAIAGALLGGSLLLSTEAGVGDAGAVLCGATTLALAALGRLYATALIDRAAGFRTRLVFWLALALAALDGGLAGPMVVVLTGLCLWAWDRRAPWARGLGWSWGLILLIAAIGPWAIAVTVRTDGQFWMPVAGRHLRGWPPGLQALMAPLLMFPATALLPAALIGAWKARLQPGVRFALCWLGPSWLVLELSPVKLVDGALPLYGALAWLAAYALTLPMSRAARRGGAALSLVAAGLLAVALCVVNARYGAGWAAAAMAGLLLLAAGAAGAAVVMAPERHRLPALAAAGGLAIIAHGMAAAAVAPALHTLWLSQRVLAVLDRSGLNPADGLTPGPVTVAGYAEPSLVFALGTETELGDADAAAEAISEGRPVVIEQHDEAAFHKDLAEGDLKATPVGTVAGVDYTIGKPNILTIYRSDSPPPQDSPSDNISDGAAAQASAPSPAPAKEKP
jgi:4-amino-4-deoxy-L-arabinose transferase-like glycosyltransferase